jgi:hypothetical protein
MALLLLTLRDFARGLIPVGYAGNRGMGAIHVDAVTHRGSGNLPEPLMLLAGEYRDSGEWEGLPIELIESLRQEWREFIEEHGSVPNDRAVSA